MKRFRENSPERNTYNNLKTNAKRRKKFFDLTFAQFLHFLQKNPDYMKKKGVACRMLQIDCRINKDGYTFNNIRSITAKENRWKSDKEFNTTDPDAEDYVPF